MRYIVFLAALVVALSACRKKPDPVPPTTIDHGGVSGDGHLKVEFNNQVGDQPLQLNSGVYVNEAGDTFSVSIYKYYISNIRLWRADSTYFDEPGSYHLVNEAQGDSKSFILHDVPVGDYVRVSYLIGVDSARNVSGAQSGALDPANAMFWDWNTGYIMAKLEGTSPQSGAAAKEIVYHAGGFSGSYSVLRWVSLSLPQPARVQQGRTPEIHLVSDVLEWFKAPMTVDFATRFHVTNPGKDASQMASNYSDMFHVDHVVN
ncbi:MAG: hypothetical protein JNL72_00235 [Flavipsychrobacter sp.]|nr:hypothetical protein [Flavipsychrobacter sp.]